MSVTKIDEEKNIHLDVLGKGKSVEQLKKHSLDSGLENKPIDRAMYILTSGEDVQKISIIQSLPQLVRIDVNAMNTRILPKIQQDLPNSSSELQMTASAAFRTLMDMNVDLNVLHSIIQGVDSKDPNVSVSWCDTLLATIPKLSEDVMKKTILPIIKLKSTPNNTVASKVLCCKIMGSVCIYPNLKTIDIKKDVIPYALSLSQDSSPEVRAAICSHLPSIAQGVGSSFVTTDLLPSLVELASDGNNFVRSAAIESIAQMLPNFENETKKATMIPLLKRLCERSSMKGDTTSLVLATAFGRILEGIENCIPDADRLYFLQIFRSLSQRGKLSNESKADAAKEVLCRERCAFNLLTVLQFTLRTAPDQLTFVYNIYKELAVDPCYLVRRSIAESLAGVAKALGAQNKLMKNEIVRLVRDDTIEVLDMVVPNISSILLSLVEHKAISNTNSNPVSGEICKGLFKCQTELSRGYNWRLMVLFLQQLETLPYCIPSELIHNNFTPVIMDKLNNGRAKPIRLQAIRTLVIFMRYNFKPNQNRWLRDALIKQVAQSQNSYTRMLYFDVCNAVLDIYSEKYFKENFLSPLLSLAYDKVPSVRYGFMIFTGRLKQLVTFTTDAKTRQVVFDVISKMEAAERKPFMLQVLHAKKQRQSNRIDDQLKEEQRRIAEEGTMNIRMPTVMNKTAQQKQSTPQIPARPNRLQLTVDSNGPKTPSSSRTSTRSLQLQNTGLGQKSALKTTPNQEMSFLAQHFYIDAGVSLPQQDESEPKALDETILSSNITDDVKVNLRKMTSKLVPPKIYKANSESDLKIKRHSSVISVSCFDMTRNAQRRRSLHLSTSRIPVCTRNKSDLGMPIRESSGEKSNDDLCDTGCATTNLTDNHKMKSVSSLPVFIRNKLVMQKK